MLVLVHESIHYIFAKIFWKEIDEIKIGSDALSVKIRKLSISPIIGNSFIIINEEQLNTSYRYQIVLFFYDAYGVQSRSKHCICFHAR